ncbi:major facilitator superfamily domain-containing protein [Crepidotus variabilis]|uniref:Major facilitator superfamily domain-containing protein n=1 Tax=Crepidotus variabilis TaxID=179855 RepID=A0A9P6EPC2_9AGAR|nr:major facilitator superfamily domain-containing protein [Crepidotus variabilis]
MSPPQRLQEATEEDSLLVHSQSATTRKRRSGMWRQMRSLRLSWEAHPYWLIPVVLVMSMSRGLTLSPRIQVYKAIACRAISEETPGMVPDLGAFMECGDAAVQARAAKISASIVTLMSVLSAISTGFWSRLGDKHGRKLILTTFLIGALSMEAVFVLVMKPNSFFGQHAERLILVGPILEGFVGGLSTFNGVVHAYISDCTQHGSRSKIFSTVQGIIFVGLAIGPWIGGLFFPPKGYSDGFFLGSISLITITILYVAFIMPESRKPAAREASQHNDEEISFKKSPIEVAQRVTTTFLSALLLPISMFAPRRIPGSSRRNWNMTLCGLSLFLYLVSTGVYSAKYLYAQHVYEWTTAQLGYYMSTLWITRAINLLLFLPIILSYLKPKSTSAAGATPTSRDISAEMNFDRQLARISVAVDGLADGLVAVTGSKSEPLFYTFSCLSSFTSGGNPSLHSLGAVCLHACGRGSEVGALFGAMGVLSAIAHIVSPYVYALTYGATVARFPEAIFVLAFCFLFSVVFLLTQLDVAEEKIVAVDDADPAGPSRRNSNNYTYQSLATTLTDEEQPVTESRRSGSW